MDDFEDRILAKLAVKRCLASHEQVDECRKIRDEMAAHAKPMPLGQLLLKKRYIRSDDLMELLRELRLGTLSCWACGFKFFSRPREKPRKVSCPNCNNTNSVPAFVPESAEAPTKPPVQKDAGRHPISEATGDSILKSPFFGPYEILRELSRGAMGVVFKARHREIPGRLVALKVLREGKEATDEQVQRFEREAETAAQLEHRNIVRIHEAGEQDGLHYYTMDYVEGESLYHWLRKSAAPLKRRLEILLEIMDGIAFAHRRGVVHRDLKFANILLDADGRPRIIDFGLAKILADESTLTRTGELIGTPLYMAPEQVKGKMKEMSSLIHSF